MLYGPTTTTPWPTMQSMKGQPKLCESCHEPYQKNPDITYVQWSLSRYCSRRCMGIAKRGKRHSDAHRAAISAGNMGRTFDAETRRKISESNRGKRRTPEQRRRISAAHKGIPSPRKGQKHSVRGRRHWNWRGGVTHPNRLLRRSLEYRAWRTAVFERDNWTCVSCGTRGGTLHADHIRPFAYYPALRFEVSNGRTMCVPCHGQTDTYGYRAHAHAPLALAKC